MQDAIDEAERAGILRVYESRGETLGHAMDHAEQKERESMRREGDASQLRTRRSNLEMKILGFERTADFIWMSTVLFLSLVIT